MPTLRLQICLAVHFLRFDPSEECIARVKERNKAIPGVKSGVLTVATCDGIHDISSILGWYQK